MIRAGRFALPLGLFVLHLGIASAGTPPPARARDDTSLSYLGRVVSNFPLSEGAALYYLALPAYGERYDQATRSELERRLRAVVPLSNPNLAVLDAQSDSEAIDVARTKRKPLVKLSVSFEGNHAKVRIAELSFARLFWQRVKAPGGSIVSEQNLRITLDSSLLGGTNVGPLTSEGSFSSPIADALAVDCGIFPGENEPRITLLGRRKIVSGHLRGEKFERIAEQNLDALSALASSPLRMAIGAIRSDGEKFLVGSSDRDALLVLSPKLEKLAALPRGYPRSMNECSSFLEDGVSPLLRACTEENSSDIPPNPERRFQLEIDFSPSEPSLASRKIFVTQSSRSDAVWLEGSRTPLDLSSARLTRESTLVGSVTLGRREPVLFLRDGESGKLVALALDGKRIQWSSNTPEGVRAVVECPKDGTGKNAALAVGSKGLSWIH